MNLCDIFFTISANVLADHFVQVWYVTLSVITYINFVFFLKECPTVATSPEEPEIPVGHGDRGNPGLSQTIDGGDGHPG